MIAQVQATSPENEIYQKAWKNTDGTSQVHLYADTPPQDLAVEYADVRNVEYANRNTIYLIDVPGENQWCKKERQQNHLEARKKMGAHLWEDTIEEQGQVERDLANVTEELHLLNTERRAPKEDTYKANHYPLRNTPHFSAFAKVGLLFDRDDHPTNRIPQIYDEMEHRINDVIEVVGIIENTPLDMYQPHLFKLLGNH